jgi:ribA/ribD-fused uncharacterized protein
LVIDSFRGQYFFLSNFCEVPVIYDGITYLNNEVAFQAQKTINKEERIDFSMLNPSQAKRMGRRVSLRPDWEDVKFDIMYEICKAKFTQNQSYKENLLKTGDAELIEGNDWGDKIWGQVDGIGENHLGKILMRIREELKNE